MVIALVVLLDDLQWIDPAGLKLLEYIITYPDTKYLLVIGAFRDNEVGPLHPLMPALDNIRKSGTVLRTTTLSPLSMEDLGHLTADTFCSDWRRVEPLTGLLHEKTAGNPFFASQFLMALDREGLVQFDRTERLWQWDIALIETKDYTDNVADLMVRKLRKLSGRTLHELRLAACIGGRFDLSTLAMISGIPEEDVRESLGEALQEGLVLQQSATSYTFLHDRVQQAAYSLIPDSQRAGLHLQIGRVLLAHISGAALEEQIFHVVGHLTLGAGLVLDQEEKYRFAKLYVIAGKKAKASTAYASALGFYSSGVALLAPDSWEAHYELTYALHAGLAECTYLNGGLNEAGRHCDNVLSHARTNIERARMYLIKIDILTTLREITLAVASGVECLRILGIELPSGPSGEQARAEEQLVWKLLGERRIEDLIDLPPVRNLDISEALDVLVVMHPPSHYLAKQNLFMFIPAFMTTISLRHGNAPASAMSYAIFGNLLCYGFGKYREAYRFGKLACDLVDRTHAVAYRAKVYFIMGASIAPYYRPLISSLEYMDRCFEASVETGDLSFACFSRVDKLVFLLIKGSPLDEVYQESQQYLDFARKVKFEMVSNLIITEQRLIQALRGHTNHLGSFDDAGFSEAAFEARIRRDLIPDFCWYRVCRLQAHYLAGDYGSALRTIDEVNGRLGDILGDPISTEYCFYSALTLAACYPQAAVARQDEFRQTLNKQLQQLDLWADSCPGTFQNRYALVSAEVARIEGRDMEAMPLYEEAIRSARENGFVQNEALSYELAAKFWLSKGHEDFARLYIIKAHRGYGRWQALGKTKALEAQYPQWLARDAGQSPAGGANPLDVSTVMKAARAISSEIELDRLLKRIMRIVIENAGAQEGSLVLEQDGKWIIAAEGNVERVSIPPLVTVEESGRVSAGIVHYVKRTKESVVLDDAVGQGQFISYPHIQRHRVKSLLCAPLLSRNRLIGILYLENNLTTHVFTPDRVQLLKVLLSQAAISLENARVYEALREREEALRESENKYRRIVDTANEGIWVVDEDCSTTFVNARITEMLGYGVEEMIGRRFEVFMFAEDLADNARKMEARRQGVAEQFERRYRCKDGHTLWAIVSATPMFDAGHHFRGSFAMITDVTERRSLEEQLRQAVKLEAIGTLAGGIAHDFNNLMTAVIGYSDLLLYRLQKDNPLRKDIEQIRNAGLSAASLTRRLLAFSRKQVLQPKVLDLNRVVADTEKMLRRLIGEDIDLVSRLDSALGRVAADPSQIEQVVINLAVNARDAMPRGGKLTIETANVSLDESYARQHIDVRPGQYVMLAMSDTGIGMDAATLSHMFEPFFTTKETGKGTGLGLATVYGIVKQSGGHIWVYSELGQGTTFKVYLPGAEKDTESVPSDAALTELPQGRSEALLLVEDDDTVRSLAGRCLRMNGYTVIEAREGAEALKIFEEHGGSFHLLITDVVMPGMSGRELAKEITLLSPELKVLYMSGYTANAIAQHGVLDAGITLLQKPFTPEALVRRVREVLDKPTKT